MTGEIGHLSKSKVVSVNGSRVHDCIPEWVVVVVVEKVVVVVVEWVVVVVVEWVVVVVVEWILNSNKWYFR